MLGCVSPPVPFPRPAPLSALSALACSARGCETTQENSALADLGQYEAGDGQPAFCDHDVKTKGRCHRGDVAVVFAEQEWMALGARVLQLPSPKFLC